MRTGSTRRALLGTAAAALVMTGAVAAASTGRAGATGGSGSPLRARVTGTPIPGTANWRAVTTGEAAAVATPSKSGQIRRLRAVLAKIHADYSSWAGASPGPEDVLDYGIGSLWRKGIDGAGTTVAVIEGWDDPSIAKIVASYDRPLGLPNPEITTIFPSGDGKLPAKCPRGMVKLKSYGSCSGWKGELALDVISAHLMAPYAKILISATPADSEITDDAASQVAPPEMMEAIEHIAGDHLANVISISDGTGETTYSHGAEEITAQDPGELAAAAAGIPLLVATGDCGVVQNLAVANGQCEDTSAAPDTAAWDDSPWVTAVGGSVPNLSSTGARLGPDPLWHVGNFSEGAGYSEVYARPAYQDGVKTITKSAMRSVPDLTMDADDGTSEAAPLLAGVLALATQENGANVGPINTALYDVLGPKGAADGIADVVSGNDSSGGVPGFSATKGFDVASGWGTIYAPKFVPSLVAATKAAHDDRAERQSAASQLRTLERDVTVSPGSIGASRVGLLIGRGFLPGHPVRLSIDHTPLKTLVANGLGDVTYMISPSALGLKAGSHSLTLRSMLIAVKTSFRTR